MSDWSIEKARQTYSIAHWGEGYFDIDAQGRIVVRPQREKGWRKSFAGGWKRSPGGLMKRTRYARPRRNGNAWRTRSVFVWVG